MAGKIPANGRARARAPVRRPRAHRRVDTARTRGIVIDADTHRPRDANPTSGLDIAPPQYGRHRRVARRRCFLDRRPIAAPTDGTFESPRNRTPSLVDAPRHSASCDAVNSNSSTGRFMIRKNSPIRRRVRGERYRERNFRYERAVRFEFE